MSENPVALPTPWPPGWREPDPARPPRAPGTVLAAAIVTWVSSAVMTVGALSLLLFALWVGEPLFEAFEGSQRLVVVVAVLVTAWSVGAALLARAALAGRRRARLALVVSAGLTIAVSVASVFLGLPLVSLFCGVAVIVLLFTGGANEWFASEGGGALHTTERDV